LVDASPATMAEAKARIRRELYDLALRGPSAAELRRAKVAFETGHAFGALSAERRAELLATYELWYGDARAFDGALTRYRAVTVVDVQRAARTWLGWSREVELDVWPASAQLPAAGGVKPAEAKQFEQALAKLPDAGLPVAATGTAP